MAKVLVTGGTGVLGRELAPRLRERGHEVRVLSRRAGGTDVVRGDIGTGAGLPGAVAGVETVVHLASSPARHKRVDVEGTRLLVDACGAAGVQHLVYLSIVGADVIPFSYYRSKLQAEQIIDRSGVPSTVQRATQFHDLVLRAVEGLSRLPRVFLPAGIRVQPVDTRDVADRLADVVGAGPAGRVADLGGPDVFTGPEVARLCLGALARDRKISELRLPGAAMRGFQAGGNIAPAHADGRRGLAEYLSERVRRDAGGRTTVDLPYSKR